MKKIRKRFSCQNSSKFASRATNSLEIKSPHFCTDVEVMSFDFGVRNDDFEIISQAVKSKNVREILTMIRAGYNLNSTEHAVDEDGNATVRNLLISYMFCMSIFNVKLLQFCCNKLPTNQKSCN